MRNDINAMLGFNIYKRKGEEGEQEKIQIMIQ
jgi:hypothetical protein